MRKSVLVAVLVLIPISYADAQIPADEREALIALYNSTDGVNWKNNSGWLGAAGTECGWYRVVCSGGHVTYLTLNWNQLNGSLPAELGNLSSLVELRLEDNQLTGSIPPEMGNLSSLTYMSLTHNKLSGSIPPQLGNLSSLKWLYLDSNRLSGSIPPELQNLPLVAGCSNGLEIRWNALHSDDAALIAYLNNRQYGCDWQSTQTIAPVNLVVGSMGDHTVWLSWDAVS